MLTPCAEGTLGGWARERFLQLNMTIVNPPQVAETQAVFSQPFREATGAGLIGTQDPKQDGPVPAPGSQDLIFAVVRETLTLARSEAKPTRSFLDGFGGDGPPPGLGFLTRPIRRPYYLPLRGLPCRLDRQAIVWRKGEDIALAVDFGVRDRTVIFGRLAPQVRRGRT
jgi:hypothetical protein